MPARNPYHDRPRNPRFQRRSELKCQQLLSERSEKLDLRNDPAQTEKLLKRAEDLANELTYAKMEQDRLRRLLIASRRISDSQIQGQ